MTMHVNLSPEMESFIKAKVASGSYGNATEVIRDAIRRMQAEESRVQAWHAAIKKGDDELDRGEAQTTTRDALSEITKAALGSMHSGAPMDLDSKCSYYDNLVISRKRCKRCASSGLTNPSTVQDSGLDSNEIGPWSRWNGDLNARVLVVGQDWGDVATFEEQGGVDRPSPTNDMLRLLLESIGINVDVAPTPKTGSRVFLTNAVLCLKQGGLQGRVEKNCFDNCATGFLRRQIEIVHPQVVVSLGERAYEAICLAFSLPRIRFAIAVSRRKPIVLPNGTSFFPVYHCGRRVLNMYRDCKARLQHPRPPSAPAPHRSQFALPRCTGSA